MNEFEIGYAARMAGAARSYYDHSYPAQQGWDMAQRELIEANRKLDAIAEQEEI